MKIIKTTILILLLSTSLGYAKIDYCLDRDFYKACLSTSRVIGNPSIAKCCKEKESYDFFKNISCIKKDNQNEK